MIGATLSNGREVRILFAHNDYRKKAHALIEEFGVPDAVVDPFVWATRHNKPGTWKAYTHSTLCSVVVGPKETEEVLAQGESWCALGDNFSRKIGREYALRRAIENGGFNRSDTGTLLASYFGRNRGQRVKSTTTTEDSQ